MNRNSYRKVEVFEPPENLDPLWIGVASVMKVEASGTRGNESYHRCQHRSYTFGSKTQLFLCSKAY